MTNSPNKGHILILDSDDRRSCDLNAIFSFLGFNCEIIDPFSFNESMITVDTLMVILGDCIVERSSIASRIINSALPVAFVEISDSVNTIPTFELSTPHYLGILKYPAQFQEVSKLTTSAQAFRENMLKGYSGLQTAGEQRFESLVGMSSSIRKVRMLMNQVCNKDVTVLITGESGTGKEVVARNLHSHSLRREKPFIPVNCGAIPQELLESELFGHEKGAFTGAVNARTGRFELAQGGTIFLDEIGDMPMTMQVKLLRVLQERTFERVGGTKTYHADVRIIAATHRNLELAIAKGEFREDLYYRLNVFPIEMPPLRDRTEDIGLLLTEFMRRKSAEYASCIRFSSGAIMSLRDYNWPGNVRELSNLVERILITKSDGVVTSSDLPPRFQSSLIHEMEEGENHLENLECSDQSFSSVGKIPFVEESGVLIPKNGFDLKIFLSDLEKKLILQALDDCDGVVAHAADLLCIRRTTLVEKMKKYDLKKA